VTNRTIAAHTYLLLAHYQHPEDYDNRKMIHVVGDTIVVGSDVSALVPLHAEDPNNTAASKGTVANLVLTSGDFITITILAQTQ